MNQFGLGVRTGLDIGGERTGLMPTREWKRKVHREPWFPGETLITGIGQGFSLATPLQLAHATATLANHGQRFKPQIIRTTEDAQTKVAKKIVPEKINNKIVLNSANLNRIQHAMEMVVHGTRGTARRISTGIDYRIAGKTGTSQVFGIAQDEEYIVEDIAKRLQDHALFIAYAPVDKPEIAIALIVENGGSGGAVAAPIAGKVIDAYLKSIPREEK
jgi:penicillin-binding protein 2